MLFIRAGRYGHEFLLPPFAGRKQHLCARLDLAEEWFADEGLPFLLKGASLGDNPYAGTLPDLLHVHEGSG